MPSLGRIVASFPSFERPHFATSRGQLSGITRPGNIGESFTYDAPGRLISDAVSNGSSSPYRYDGNFIRSATLTYDVRDKLLRSASGLGTTDTLVSSYTPMGQVASGYTISHSRTIGGWDARAVISEAVTHDAMGNQASSNSEQDFFAPNGNSTSITSQGYVYQAGTGKLVSNPKPFVNDSVYYDGSGNEIFRTTYPTSSLDVSSYYRDRASYYAADGTLRAADARYVSTGSTQESAFFTGAFEEYRYDALGRRVWVRAHRMCDNDPDSFVAECNISKMKRTVWDGDEELYEIQMPGSDTSAYLETDTNLPALPADSSNGSTMVDPNPFFGRVAYTNALGIDQPVGIMRMNYGDRVNDAGYDVGYRALDPFLISPLWDDRGESYSATFDDGGVSKCQAPSNVGADTIQRCVYIGFAAQRFAYTRPSFRPNHWHGSLLQDKQDATGTNFRRNRYYDPEKGRFTQEDPIGLAGGVNLYGFAASDPVDFGDPLGLCCSAAEAQEAFAQIGRNMRAVQRPLELAATLVLAFPIAESGGLPALVTREPSGAESLVTKIGLKLANQLSHLDRRHLSAAARELRGATSTFDHATEVRDAARGVANSIHNLRRILGNPSTESAVRASAQKMLSRASKALDAAEAVLSK